MSVHPRLSLRIIKVIAALLLLSACAAGLGDGKDKRGTVELAPGISVNLPDKPNLGRSVDVTQLVTIRNGEQTFLMQSRLRASNGNLRLVGLDPLGRRAFTASWSKLKLEFETAPWVPKSFRVKNLFADLILIYWPHNVGAAMVGNSGATLLSDRSSRTVRRNGEDIIHIAYIPARQNIWNGDVRYQNHGWNYVIDIRSTELLP